MTVEIEGKPLFATTHLSAVDEDMWLTCLADRLEAHIAADSGNLIEACTLRPIELETSAVSWSVGAAAGVEPRIRVAKAIPFHGDPAFFQFAPRGPSLDRPNGTVRDGLLLLAATAPFATFDHARAAVERTEHRVRQFLAWQYLEIADANRQLPRMLTERRALPIAPRRSALRVQPGSAAAAA